MIFDMAGLVNLRLLHSGMAETEWVWGTDFCL